MPTTLDTASVALFASRAGGLPRAGSRRAALIFPQRAVAGVHAVKRFVGPVSNKLTVLEEETPMCELDCVRIVRASSRAHGSPRTLHRSHKSPAPRRAT